MRRTHCSGARPTTCSRASGPASPTTPRASADQRDISRLDDAIEKIVVSDGITQDETDPWRETTRIVRRAGAHDRVAALKNSAGEGEILVFGSHALWNDLLTAGLVDELHLMVGSFVVGEGTPAFAAGLAGRLELTDTRTWDESDSVLLRYAVRA